MEKHYMSLIWSVFGLKEYEHLSNEEKQDKIVDILSCMKKDAQDFERTKFKKECIKAVADSVNCL